MTIERTYRVKCRLCQLHYKREFYLSFHSWNKGYLDGGGADRPYPQACPHCGYVSFDYKAAPGVKIDLVESEAYQNGNGNFPPLVYGDIEIRDNTLDYYRYYLLSKARQNFEDMYYSLLECLHNPQGKYRKVFLPEIYVLFCEVFKEQLANKDKQILALQIEYLRLLGKFRQAMRLLKSLDYSNMEDAIDRKLVYEEKCIAAQDDRPHKYEELDLPPRPKRKHFI